MGALDNGRATHVGKFDSTYHYAYLTIMNYNKMVSARITMWDKMVACKAEWGNDGKWKKPLLAMSIDSDLTTGTANLQPHELINRVNLLYPKLLTSLVYNVDNCLDTRLRFIGDDYWHLVCELEEAGKVPDDDEDIDEDTDRLALLRRIDALTAERNELKDKLDTITRLASMVTKVTLKDPSASSASDASTSGSACCSSVANVAN